MLFHFDNLFFLYRIFLCTRRQQLKWWHRGNIECVAYTHFDVRLVSHFVYLLVAVVTAAVEEPCLNWHTHGKIVDSWQTPRDILSHSSMTFISTLRLTAANDGIRRWLGIIAIEQKIRHNKKSTRKGVLFGSEKFSFERNKSNLLLCDFCNTNWTLEVKLVHELFVKFQNNARSNSRIIAN